MSGSADPLAALHARFLDRLVDDRAPLERAAAYGELPTVRTITHKIAGAGGLFGFHRLSALASRVEEAVDLNAPSASISSLLTDLLGAIDDSLAARG